MRPLLRSFEGQTAVITGELPTSSQGHCGALTPQSGGAPSPLFWSVPPCSFRQPRNGAVLRCAAPPSGWLPLRAALCQGAGRDEGMVVTVEPRDGTKVRQWRPRRHVPG